MFAEYIVLNTVKPGKPLVEKITYFCRKMHINYMMIQLDCNDDCT